MVDGAVPSWQLPISRNYHYSALVITDSGCLTVPGSPAHHSWWVKAQHCNWALLMIASLLMRVCESLLVIFTPMAPEDYRGEGGRTEEEKTAHRTHPTVCKLYPLC